MGAGLRSPFFISVFAGIVVYIIQLGAESQIAATLSAWLTALGFPAKYTLGMSRLFVIVLTVTGLGFALSFAEKFSESVGLGIYRCLPEHVLATILRYTNERCNDYKSGSRDQHFALIKNMLTDLCGRLDKSVLHGASFRAAIFCPGKEGGGGAGRLYCRISRNAAGAKNPIQERAGFFEPGEGLAGSAFVALSPRMGSAKWRIPVLRNPDFKEFSGEMADEDRSVFCLPILHRDDNGSCLGILSIDSTDTRDFSGGRRKVTAIVTGFAPIARILSEHLSELAANGELWLDSERISIDISAGKDQDHDQADT